MNCQTILKIENFSFKDFAGRIEQSDELKSFVRKGLFPVSSDLTKRNPSAHT